MTDQSRKCKCGCGEYPGGTFLYKRGHKPKGTTAETQLARVEPVIEVTAVEPEEEYVDISFNAASLDRLFNMLSLYEKSVAVAAALGSE